MDSRDMKTLRILSNRLAKYQGLAESAYKLVSFDMMPMLQAEAIEDRCKSEVTGTIVEISQWANAMLEQDR